MVSITQDEGHRVFLEDQKMYDQERRRLIQRELPEKVPDEGEKEKNWRDLEHHQQQAAEAKREIR
jgi:hypothetical protein